MQQSRIGEWPLLYTSSVCLSVCLSVCHGLSTYRKSLQLQATEALLQCNQLSKMSPLNCHPTICNRVSGAVVHLTTSTARCILDIYQCFDQQIQLTHACPKHALHAPSTGVDVGMGLLLPLTCLTCETKVDTVEGRCPQINDWVPHHSKDKGSLQSVKNSSTVPPS